MPNEPKTIQINKDSLAWKWFSAFVSDTRVDVTEDDLRTYLKQDLKVDLDRLEPGLVVTLPLMLVVFMKSWSGWQSQKDFREGKFTKEHYFIRFQKFLTYKINYVIKTGYATAIRELKRENITFTDEQFKAMVAPRAESPPPSSIVPLPPDFQPVEAKDVVEKQALEFAPYTVMLNCPPHMLNTIVFTNTGDDIVLKHHLGRHWEKLSTVQLLNWPYVQVNFITPGLFFVRRQVTHYTRYLNFLPQECKRTDDDVIENVESTLARGRRNCFTLRVLEAFLREYIESLKCLNSGQLPAAKFEEIYTVIQQFCEDLSFLNLRQSIATNTKVSFKLTKSLFIRNKKLVKDNDEDDKDRVGYCEVLAPKTEVILKSFQPKQIVARTVKFTHTEKLKQLKNDPRRLKEFLPNISYNCTFCGLNFHSHNAKQDILDHLYKHHKMEQPVRCTHCKKQFDVAHLATNRWAHACTA